MNKYWIECALKRALKTVAQTAAATIGTATVLSSVDWKMVVSASILAGILSILTSVAGLPEVGMMKDQLEGVDDDPFDEAEADDDDDEFEEVEVEAEEEVAEEELGEDNAEEVEEV